MICDRIGGGLTSFISYICRLSTLGGAFDDNIMIDGMMNKKWKSDMIVIVHLHAEDLLIIIIRWIYYFPAMIS